MQEHVMVKITCHHADEYRLMTGQNLELLFANYAMQC